MIARLRRRHRRAWLALAVVLPLILWAAWRAHRPVGMMDQLPAALRAPEGPP